jgi:acetylornithine deacetylase/succinyl-diaminopimelate desuccinylase-like protein
VTEPVSMERDAVELCRDLLRLDTSNPGQVERPAAEYVAERLGEVGIEGRIYESDAGRATFVARVEGDGTSNDALVVHSHIDVVPAVAADWTHHPFAAEEADGCLWGRGAVDMKDMVAMMTAVVRGMARDGIRPHRDLILVYFADEEAGGAMGADFMVREHPECFDGATAAIGEVGGFSVAVAGRDDVRLYPIQVAEKGMLWMRLKARGRAGHGSMPHDDNAVVKLAEAVARLGRARFPRRLTPTTEALLRELGELLGIEFDLEHPEEALEMLGTFRTFLEPVLSDTVSPTMLTAGQKVNVIPSEAEAAIDGRFLPGHEEGFLAEIDKLLGADVARETIHFGRTVEAPWDHPLVRAMCDALRAEDAAAHPVPHMISGGTDAKHLVRLGLDCYGFTPLLLPPDLDFARMFHGVDERVPIDALGFGARVLHRLLSRY